MGMNDEVILKFWSQVEKTKSCWNWTGPLDKSGLPIIRVGGRKNFQEFSSRRVSLEIDGQSLQPTKRVQPWCRNKLCLNPSHLAHGDEARFWAKVHRSKEDECWVWLGGQDKNMYGKFRVCQDGKKMDIRAHRYSWFLFSDRMPPPAVEVCHTCDHPYCVNPKHLFLGTTQDNTKDRDEKGRQSKGETHHKATLTEVQVKQIRELNATGNYTQFQLSDLFGVSQTAISSIVLRKTWKHIA